MPEQPLIVILGPTAVGKTDIAIQLAERLGGEVVSADSRYFYRGMDIGTAKPSAAEMRAVPHHLIDIANPDEVVSLAQFRRRAAEAIDQIQARGRVALLVGGTGQYLRAVAQGWLPPEVAPDPALRAVLEAWAAEIGPLGLHARLALLDPPAAAAIDGRNLRRTVRALEVILVTGRRFSAQRQAGPAPYRLLQIGLIRPREELYARIDARIEHMLAAGLLDEVRRLLAAGYAPDLPAFSAIGYREAIAHLQGEISLDEALVLMRRNTRTFVRRQTNWFKPDDATIHWFEAGVGAIDTIEQLGRAFLQGAAGA